MTESHQQLLLGIAIGAVLAAWGYMAVLLAMKIWRILTSFEASLREAVKLTKAFQGDFELLRKVFLGINATHEEMNSSEPEDEGDEERPARQPKPAPFPAPVFDRFKQEPVGDQGKPDAAPEDGGDVTGNEEDIINAERIDTLRDAGFVVGDPNEVHPGREVDAP